MPRMIKKAPFHVRSEVKEDLLIRSSKYVKVEAFNQSLTNEEMPPYGSPPGPVSLKGNLMGKNSRDIHEEMDDLLLDEDDGDERKEEDESDCPSIK